MTWYEQLDKQLAAYMPELKVEREVPMSRYTSFRIGGPARRMAFPESREQVVILMNLAREAGARPLLIGNGTNLLVTDEGLDRLVICTAGHMEQIERADKTIIEADAGISLAKLAIYARREGLAGLEFAHGIPGTLGGAVCMNAGAYGGEMKQVIREVTALTESGVVRYSGEECGFGYRSSIFADGRAVVLGAKLALTPGDPEAIQARMTELMAKRKASQPLEYPSAGSTFKRPEGYFAGTLIDQTGLKGLTVGGAQVSIKHAGFVINAGGATFRDVTQLMQQVQRAVYERTGIQLEPEVKIIRK